MTESEKEKAEAAAAVIAGAGVGGVVPRWAFWNSPLKVVSPPGQLVTPAHSEWRVNRQAPRRTAPSQVGPFAMCRKRNRYWRRALPSESPLCTKVTSIVSRMDREIAHHVGNLIPRTEAVGTSAKLELLWEHHHLSYSASC
jgi:hypothetical protein